MRLGENWVTTALEFMLFINCQIEEHEMDGKYYVVLT
jgi:hypothetical protein